MIALDANTALRPYREAVFDLGALADGLLAIVGGSPYVYWFKYADGRTQPVPTRALVHQLTGAFPRIRLGETVSVVWRSGAVHVEYASAEADDARRLLALLGPTLGEAWVRSMKATLAMLDSYTGVAAEIDGSKLEYGGDSTPDIKKGYFKKLTITGSLSVDDASQLLEGQTVGELAGGITSQGDAILDNASASALSSYTWGKQRVGEGAIGRLAFPGATLQATQYVAHPNMIRMQTLGTAERPAYFGQLSLTQRLADEIDISSSSMEAVCAALTTAGIAVQSFRYHLPYYDGTSVSYPVAGTIVHQLLQAEKAYAAPAGMADMLIWPCWALVGTGPVDHYYYTDCYMYAFESQYIVRVKNVSDEAVRGIANVWRFSRNGASVQASVLNRVTLPPASSVEFLFSYDREANAAYMYPLRALED